MRVIQLIVLLSILILSFRFEEVNNAPAWIFGFLYFLLLTFRVERRRRPADGALDDRVTATARHQRGRRRRGRLGNERKLRRGSFLIIACKVCH